MSVPQDRAIGGEGRIVLRKTVEVLAVPLIVGLHAAMAAFVLLYIRNEILHEFRDEAHLHFAWPVFLLVSLSSLIVIPSGMAFLARHRLKSKLYLFCWLLFINVAWYALASGDEFYATWVYARC
ncbi:MAG: hypothetical protein IH987_07055 [Planctomycetes bacterium]|nr:hypothetical protein [Planctomycetota bacterium]